MWRKKKSGELGSHASNNTGHAILVIVAHRSSECCECKENLKREGK
jgi:hypothetical protein